MAGEVVDPRTGITYGWDLGDSTWKTGMDTNLKTLGLMQQLSVIDRDLTAPPGSESDGDTYIPASTASGDWLGEEGNIAIYVAEDLAWTFLTPNEGWLCYIEDEDVLAGYNGSIWTKGVELTQQKSVLSQALTTPPGSESDGDAYIPLATATGEWAGFEDYIAIYSSELVAYYFILPVLGHMVWDVNTTAVYVWDGTNWTAV